MRKWRLLLVVILFLCYFTPAQAEVSQQDLAHQKTALTNAMATYRRHYAEYSRYRQLYGRTNSPDHLISTLEEAKTVYANRNQVMVDFSAYLYHLLDYYAPPSQEVLTKKLQANLASQQKSYLALDNDFTARDGLYKSDDDFARINSGSQETIFQTFALISYRETYNIFQEYTNLYLSQQQRLLQEAKNQVDKEQKNKILEQTKRFLTTFKTTLEQMRLQVDKVNSRDQYFQFKTKLDAEINNLEASLKLYANLE